MFGKVLTLNLIFFFSYIVSSLQHFLNVMVHIVMIQRHEQRVDDNAKRDKQLCERIKYDSRNSFLKFQPAEATIPNAESFNAFIHRFDHFLF